MGSLGEDGGWVSVWWEVCTFHHLLRCKKQKSLMRAGQINSAGTQVWHSDGRRQPAGPQPENFSG